MKLSTPKPLHEKDHRFLQVLKKGELFAGLNKKMKSCPGLNQVVEGEIERKVGGVVIENPRGYSREYIWLLNTIRDNLRPWSLGINHGIMYKDRSGMIYYVPGR